MEDNFSIINLTKKKIPELALPTGRQAFLLLKNDILGKNYNLSLAFIGKSEMRKLNKAHREKDKATNILSFPLSKNSGEILICPDVVRTETGKFNKNFRELLGFLVIHGCLHLKGMEHGSTMERAEKKYDKKYFGRN